MNDGKKSAIWLLLFALLFLIFALTMSNTKKIYRGFSKKYGKEIYETVDNTGTANFLRIVGYTLSGVFTYAGVAVYVNSKQDD